MNLFIQIIKSLVTIIILNFFFVYLKLIKKKKIIFFYHTENEIKDISLDYINHFFLKKKKYHETFFGYNGKNIKIKRYFFINEQLLRFLFGVNYFVTNYLNSIYPPKSKKIYIHHDIYDTPLVAKKFEKKIYLSLSKINYIFISSKIAEKIFIEGFKKFKIKKIPKLIISGYLKLAYLESLNLVKKSKFSKIKSVVIAPTQYKSFRNLSLLNNLNFILKKLLDNNFKVILRPHPLNRDDKNLLSFKKKYSNHKNFLYDKSSNYIHSYLNSSFMITDISGTAYTYAFLTFRPVLFFSSPRKEKFIKKYFNKELKYFKNRFKIGVVLYNKNRFINLIYKIYSSNKFHNSIQIEKKKIITGKKVIQKINYIFDKLI